MKIDIFTPENVILLTVTLISILGNIIQFFILRKTHKKDILIERKYIAYSNYMKKVDDIMYNIRKDPNEIIKSFFEFIKQISSIDSEDTNEQLIKFNEKLFEYVKTATEPLLVMRHELNTLMLICSIELKKDINKLIELVIDFNNEMQKCLSIISKKDTSSIIHELQTLEHNERWKQFQTLSDEILEKMRDEIGSNNEKTYIK